MHLLGHFLGQAKRQDRDEAIADARSAYFADDRLSQVRSIRFGCGVPRPIAGQRFGSRL